MVSCAGNFFDCYALDWKKTLIDKVSGKDADKNKPRQQLQAEIAQLDKDQKNIAEEAKELESQIYQLEREMQDMEDSEVLMDAVTNELSMHIVEFDHIVETAKQAQFNDAEAEKARLLQEE